MIVIKYDLKVETTEMNQQQDIKYFREARCNTLGVCHSLSSGFELKHDRLSGDDHVKVNLWR